VSASSDNLILVVDDDAGVRETMRDLLELDGYAVIVATNGREALDLLERDGVRPRAMILDIMMPILDGNAVYEAIRKNPVLAELFVIISTSAPHLAPSGALLIRKPIVPKVLLAALRRNR
jgi:two-component system chemotaxis response regulator CheY